MTPETEHPSPSGASAQRFRLAELTSAIGAGVLGVGIGVLLPSRLNGLGILIVVVGVALHAWGMTDKHRLESEIGRRPVWWSTALYWTCWLLLAALAGWVVFRLVT
jgi:hypothetical protein